MAASTLWSLGVTSKATPYATMTSMGDKLSDKAKIQLYKKQSNDQVHDLLYGPRNSVISAGGGVARRRTSEASSKPESLKDSQLGTDQRKTSTDMGSSMRGQIAADRRKTSTDTDASIRGQIGTDQRKTSPDMGAPIRSQIAAAQRKTSNDTGASIRSQIAAAQRKTSNDTGASIRCQIAADQRKASTDTGASIRTECSTSSSETPTKRSGAVSSLDVAKGAKTTRKKLSSKRKNVDDKYTMPTHHTIASLPTTRKRVNSLHGCPDFQRPLSSPPSHQVFRKSSIPDDVVDYLIRKTSGHTRATTDGQRKIDEPIKMRPIFGEKMELEEEAIEMALELEALVRNKIQLGSAAEALVKYNTDMLKHESQDPTHFKAMQDRRELHSSFQSSLKLLDSETNRLVNHVQAQKTNIHTRKSFYHPTAGVETDADLALLHRTDALESSPPEVPPPPPTPKTSTGSESQPGPEQRDFPPSFYRQLSSKLDDRTYQYASPEEKLNSNMDVAQAVMDSWDRKTTSDHELHEHVAMGSHTRAESYFVVERLNRALVRARRSLDKRRSSVGYTPDEEVAESESTPSRNLLYKSDPNLSQIASVCTATSQSEVSLNQTGSSSKTPLLQHESSVSPPVPSSKAPPLKSVTSLDKSAASCKTSPKSDPTPNRVLLVSKTSGPTTSSQKASPETSRSSFPSHKASTVKWPAVPTLSSLDRMRRTHDQLKRATAELRKLSYDARNPTHHKHVDSVDSTNRVYYTVADDAMSPKCTQSSPQGHNMYLTDRWKQLYGHVASKSSEWSSLKQSHDKLTQKNQRKRGVKRPKGHNEKLGHSDGQGDETVAPSIPQRKHLSDIVRELQKAQSNDVQRPSSTGIANSLAI